MIFSRFQGGRCGVTHINTKAFVTARLLVVRNALVHITVAPGLANWWLLFQIEMAWHVESYVFFNLNKKLRKLIRILINLCSIFWWKYQMNLPYLCSYSHFVLSVFPNNLWIFPIYQLHLTSSSGFPNEIRIKIRHLIICC